MRPGTVFGVTGLMRSGKGLTMQWYAAQFRRAGFDVFANYDTNLATERIENIPQLLSFYRGALFVDEADLTLHAREFGSDLSIKLTKWIKMCGKQGLRFCWCTQNPYFLDINIRRLTHYVLDCAYAERYGRPGTIVRFYRVERGGEEFIFMYSKYFYHTRWLYDSYDTLDARNILSPDVGGVASVPLAPDDFRVRESKKRSDSRVSEWEQRYQQLQQRYVQLETQLRDIRGGNGHQPPLAAPEALRAEGAAKRSLF